MSNNTSNTPETLSEIIGVAIEYDLHLEPNQFINYMDLYSRYLLASRDSATSVSRDTVNFYQFICSQSLLDTAASIAKFETGESIQAPTALQPLQSWEAHGNLMPPIGVH